MRRLSYSTIPLIFLMSIGDLYACPMCRIALEDAAQQDQRPAAYMASILFMLSMPFMIFGAIGCVLYYINQQEQILAEQLTAEAINIESSSS